ncbi:aldo/keto reductase [Chryseomicrobium sp. FSL W7-1435]|uniref:aldo/keto reductase n=1 Tax=Chryseomicrobium sp. FSL W7-1435 TaxID=2921704 RepID=UPI00315B26E1
MKHVQLGKSDLTISELSLGAMTLPATQQETDAIIHTALDEGINWIDTADLYEQGDNEKRVGRSLEGRREFVHLSTKVGNRFVEGKEGWNWDPNPKWIAEAVENSLNRLQTDYIDLYQLHGGTKEDDWDGIIEVFEKLQDRGLIRHYGLSSIRPNVIYPYFNNSRAISVMMQYSGLDRRGEDVFPFIEEHNLGLLVRGGQAKGLLTDAAVEKLKKVSSYGSYQEKELEETVHQMKNALPNLGAVSLHHILQQPAVSSVVIGTSKLNQLQDSLQNYKQAVTKAEIEKFQSFTHPESFKEHVE